MTILIALAHKNFVFLASDTLRRDLLYKDLKFTVSKMRISGSNGLIMGGMNIDRTKLANALIKSKDAGEPFIGAANRLAPELFAEKSADLQRLPVSERQQTVISVYGEAHDGGCTAYAHQVGDPCTWAFPFKGVFVSNPTMNKSSTDKAKSLLTRPGCIPLDLWAESVLTEAIGCMPNVVDFPCDIALLQPRCEPIVSRIMRDSVADPKFQVQISESDLDYQSGSVQIF